MEPSFKRSGSLFCCLHALKMIINPDKPSSAANFVFEILFMM
jgi:hypothetical protein